MSESVVVVVVVVQRERHTRPIDVCRERERRTSQLTRARESAEVASVTAQRSPKSSRGMSTSGREIKFGCRGSNGRLDDC